MYYFYKKDTMKIITPKFEKLFEEYTYSICAKSKILISFCSLVLSSPNVSLSSGNSDFSRLTILFHIYDNFSDNFGTMLSIKKSFWFCRFYCRFVREL